MLQQKYSWTQNACSLEMHNTQDSNLYLCQKPWTKEVQNQNSLWDIWWQMSWDNRFTSLLKWRWRQIASPEVWLRLLVVLMNIALDRVILEWIHIKSPDSSTRHSCLSNAFVDDTSLDYIDHGFLVTLKNHDHETKQHCTAQIWWKTLLFYSGGALNL